MALWIIVLLFICTTLLVLQHKRSRYYQLMERIPALKRAFLFGNTLQFVKKREEFIDNFKKVIEPIAHNPIVCIWLFHLPHVLVLKSSAAEALLNNSQHIEKSRAYNFMRPWLGYGLLTSTGQKWRSHRKALTPSFHFHILKNFIPTFNEESEVLTAKLMEHAGKGPFDIFPYITLCTLDIICATAMGKQIHAQSNQNSPYVKAIFGMSEIVLARGLKVWLQIPFIFRMSSYGKLQKDYLQILHTFTNDVIAERKKANEEKKKLNKETTTWSNGNIGEDDNDNIYGRKRRLAFLDTLLEASDGNQRLTDEEIREEVDTFMFEGHDTTAAGISFALTFLGWCPSIQAKVHQELDRVFGDSDRPVTYEDLSELKYLEGVIKESLRVAPSVPIFGRHLNADLDVCGYTIPAGAEVYVLPNAVQNDPDIYQNPLCFDPMRFVNEDLHHRDPFAYIPFSAGPRNCIGQKFAIMEEKVVIANILRKFEITSSQPPYNVKLVPELILRPLQGIKITLVLRKPH